MHRHLTVLRRSNLSSGVVIQESERGRPWADSMVVVRDCAEQILKELEPDQVLSSKQSASLLSFRDYLSIHGTRLAFDLDYLTELVEASERVLEIGALPFMLTLPLMRRGYNMTAVDKPTSEWDPLVPMRLGLNHVACDLDIQPLPFKADPFDVVLMNQVFAHLRVDLIRSMGEIFRVLRPGGLLFLSSPNLRSFRALAQLIFRGDACAFMGSVHYNYSSLESHGFMGQIRVYTSKEIADFLAAMSFRVGGVIYRGQVNAGRLARFANSAASVWPSFRPDFTLLAVKPSGTSAGLCR